MPASDSRAVGFGAGDVDVLPEYRSLNRLAVASFILALLSATALRIPCSGSCRPLPRWWRCSQGAALQAHGEQRGAALAKTAWMIALLFAACAVSWHFSYYVTLSRQAQRYSQAWLDLLARVRLTSRIN